MAILHESDIEQMLIDQLKAKGYQYLYGPDIAPDGETPMRASFDEVVLRDKLEKAVKRLNPSLPYSVQDEAVKTVLRISSPAKGCGSSTSTTRGTTSLQWSISSPSSKTDITAVPMCCSL